MAKKRKIKKYNIGGNIDLAQFAGDAIGSPMGPLGAVGSLIAGDYKKKKKGGIVNNKGGIEASLKRRREEERKQSKVSKYGNKGMITPNYKKGNRDTFTQQYD